MSDDGSQRPVRRKNRPMEAVDRHPRARVVGTVANDISSPVYWDKRYQKQREAMGPDYTFEWYCELDMGACPARLGTMSVADAGLSSRISANAFAGCVHGVRRAAHPGVRLRQLEVE